MKTLKPLMMIATMVGMPFFGTVVHASDECDKHVEKFEKYAEHYSILTNEAKNARLLHAYVSDLLEEKHQYYLGLKNQYQTCVPTGYCEPLRLQLEGRFHVLGMLKQQESKKIDHVYRIETKLEQIKETSQTLAETISKQCSA